MSEKPNGRLEVFCDGVFAIALTLLIIEIKVPASENIHTTDDLWLALKHLMPAIFVFLLSFVIIFINLVNHHNCLKLVDKSSNYFIYANGFFLLNIVFIPFPTALLGEYIFTDHAAPAVVLYTAVDVVNGLGWFFLTLSALKPVPLTINEKATRLMQQNHKFSYFAIILYTICAILAFWFPLTIAVVITVVWIFWLIYGISIKTE